MLDISFGKNRSDKNWKVEYVEWEEFVELLKKVRMTNETMAEYDKMSKDDKDKIKNGRAFVGGFIKGGRRKKENVQNRWLITLDADTADKDFSFYVDLVLGGNAYAIYSTHSCRPDKLKYRLVIPVNRAMTPDEHAAVSRKVAGNIGLHYFDKTTFDVHRLMYLPSCSKDAKPVLEIAEGNFLDVDDVLEEYNDWRDSSEWPRHPDEKKPDDASIIKLGDPTEKPGVIGVFCQVYTMTEGIQKFLPDVYAPTSYEDRWTYTGGTSFGGLRVYDDTWAYSEHQSDPANDGHCHSIFDLIRIHKFGSLDTDVKDHTPSTKYPSYIKMVEFAANDPSVKIIRINQIGDDFNTDIDDNQEPDIWKTQLDIDPKSKSGEPLPTSKNAEIILRNGPFKNILSYDAFGNTEVIRGSLPWRGRERKDTEYEPWLGADDDRMLHYFGKTYNFNISLRIKNAFKEVTRSNAFHPIKEFLESVAWDEVERVDTLFSTYLGSTDGLYEREATRKILVAACKRIYEPGCKFDEMVVLVGPQGSHKSSLIARLSGKWFSDSLRNLDNKEAGEQLQKAWIIELGELSALKRTEMEEVKAFLSKTEDRYRVAYDRVVSEFPRKCVFFGTTNTFDFLKDPTGGRRFWPIEVVPENRKQIHFKHLTDDVLVQIWAEALHYYRNGESLQLSPEANEIAITRQKRHMEEDPREGLIQDYLENPIDDISELNGTLRKKTCAAEIWVECLGNKKGTMGRWEAREMCNILRRIPGWHEHPSRLVFEGYGKQTAFIRNSDEDNGH